MKNRFNLQNFLKITVVLTGAAIISMATLKAQAQNQDAGILQRQLQDQMDKSQPAPKDLKSERSAEDVTFDPNAQKIRFTGYRFNGNSVLNNEQLQAIVKPWNNRELTVGQLKEVTVAIQEAYSKVARVAQASVPPQELDGGILMIDILEARLGEVKIDTSSSKKPIRFSTDRAKNFIISRNKIDDLVDSQSVYRGMSLLNELPGVKASASMEPGSAKGKTNIKVKLDSAPLFVGQLATSNFGSKSTGAEQLIANVSVLNPFGFGDLLRVDAIKSEGSNFIQSSYLVPVGNDGWKLGVQASYLDFKTLSSWSRTRTEGDATTYGARASYAITRIPGRHTDANFTIENRSFKNTQLSNTIGKYDMTVMTAGLNTYFADTESSMVNAGVTATLGRLNIDDESQKAQDALTTKSSGSFAKLNYNISRNKELSFIPKSNLILSSYGQLSNKNLNANEQFYLGGPYGVRAYPVAQSGGSQGAVISAELQHRVHDHWVVSEFVDVGVVQQFKDKYEGWQGPDNITNADNVYTLKAVGAAVKFNYEKINISATAAYRLGDNPLRTQTGQQRNADDDYKAVQFWLRGSVDF